VLDTKKAANIAAAIRKEVHKEGIEGTMEIVGETFK
jgi:hypothetical protein